MAYKEMADGNKGSWLVYFIMLSLGMAMLLAYNSFIASPSYMSKYYQYASGNKDAVAKYPNIWSNMETVIAITSMVPNFFLQIYIVSPHGQSLSIHKRILISMVVLTIAVIIVAILPAFKPDELSALSLLITGVALAGASTAFFQSSAFGLVSMLPERFVQAVMLGIGVSGAGTSLLLIIIQASVNEANFDGYKQEANLFFGIAAAWLVLCLGMVVFMPRIPYLAARIPEYGGSLDYDKHQNPTSVFPTDDEEPQRNVNSQETVPLTMSPTGGDAVAARGIVQIVKVIWPFMVANFLIYTVSLILFPELCSNSFPNSDWFPIVVVFMFNFGDTCGRFICRFKRLHAPPKVLLPVSILRFVFIPLVVLTVSPHKIPGVALPYIIQYVTGVTNGYTSSLCMMYAPSSPQLADSERARAGSFMSFSLLGGCSAGSLLALLVNYYVQPS
jgi:equilibrative nucleoside transporter 1/2/3